MGRLTQQENNFINYRPPNCGILYAPTFRNLGISGSTPFSGSASDYPYFKA